MCWAGRVWIEEYLSTLTKEELQKVKDSERKSNSAYRFGDGVESKSMKTLDLPAIIGNKKFLIEVDIVENQIPLLISKPTMSKIGMKIDFAKNIAIVDGETLKLDCTSSGHYCLPVSCFVREDCKVVLNVDGIIDTSLSEKKQKAHKLHRQFCHASKERLQRLVKSAGCIDKEFLKAIEISCAECEFCRKYKRPFPKPIVGFQVAEHFNQVVCVDLKELEKGKLWILHMIDGATQYTAAYIINTKTKEMIVESFST